MSARRADFKMRRAICARATNVETSHDAPALRASAVPQQSDGLGLNRNRAQQESREVGHVLFKLRLRAAGRPRLTAARLGSARRFVAGGVSLPLRGEEAVCTRHGVRAKRRCAGGPSGHAVRARSRCSRAGAADASVSASGCTFEMASAPLIHGMCLTGQLLDRSDGFDVGGRNQGDGDAAAAGPAGTADAMDVIVRVMRDVEIIDVADIGDVEAACSDVGGDQQRDFVLAEGVERGGTFRLAHIAVQFLHREASAA